MTDKEKLEIARKALKHYAEACAPYAHWVAESALAQIDRDGSDGEPEAAPVACEKCNGSGFVNWDGPGQLHCECNPLLPVAAPVESIGEEELSQWQSDISADSAYGLVGVSNDQAMRLISTIRALRAELDTERMRLAACGVAALANTKETAKERIERDNPCWSASYGDVCNAVDREMVYRAHLAEVERKLTRANDGACDLCGGTDYEDMICDKCYKEVYTLRVENERLRELLVRVENLWGEPKISKPRTGPDPTLLQDIETALAESRDAGEQHAWDVRLQKRDAEICYLRSSLAEMEGQLSCTNAHAETADGEGPALGHGAAMYCGQCYRVLEERLAEVEKDAAHSRVLLDDAHKEAWEIAEQLHRIETRAPTFAELDNVRSELDEARKDARRYQDELLAFRSKMNSQDFEGISWEVRYAWVCRIDAALGVWRG